MSNIANASLVDVKRIEIPDRCRRKGDAVEDDKLRNSIEKGGIQVPLVVSRLSSEKYVLIDGYRRWQIAAFLGIPRVPCVIDEIPPGVSPEAYRNRVRFILDEHRQDLLPSQRASLINTLKDRFKMNNRQVGAYLGVDASTVGTWLTVDKLIPEVMDAVDSEIITLHAARAFQGMTPEGQRRVWEEQQHIFGDKKNWSAPRLHKHVREVYPPDKCPKMYTRPEAVLENLRRPQRKRQAKKRPIIGQAEKAALLHDLDLIKTELSENHAEVQRLKQEIDLATPIIREIFRHENLVTLVPEQLRAELEEFADARV